MDKCNCGSGKKKWAVEDGYNIFLCYVCVDCHAKKMRGFRPDIMEKYDAQEPIEPED